jgi:hypothetical protein
MHRFVSLSLAGLLTCASLALADGKDKELPWTKLTVSAARAPVPSLKYTLLPELRDIKPGNAALLYQRAHSPEWFSEFRRHPDYAKYYDWFELPLEKFPKDRALGILPVNALREVDLAARREYCDWELTDRARTDGMNMLVSDIQTFREFASFLQLRSQIEMVDRRFDKVVYSLQTGYTLGRHVSDAPTLIHGLVGIAITNMMNKRVEQMMSLEGAPNLYWALTDLPQPFLDLRRCFQGERFIVEGLFPGLTELLSDVKSRALAPGEIREHLRRASRLDEKWRGNEATFHFAASVMAAQTYPEARKYLIEQGRAAKDVDALPVIQVGLLYAVSIYDRYLDDIRKWRATPYWQAVPGLRRMDSELRNLRDSDLAHRFAAMLVPAVQKVLLARARLDRQIAMLRCIEALRLHAAEHDGKLPAALADIKSVPIPLDPMTGNAFTYKVADGKAYLSAAPPPGETPVFEGNVQRYEITLRTK